ncbi:ankyrin repeat-containing protein NPR4-like protein [Cinnamomum micranthum f. kanehirae]|uniref:Ankyrin repeat-containing protein NPR4-like protein n=1 Tax=Cinnamomum micranthum f. kanehirae TaxID=337451 RepID=A0A443PUQ5_9MAGN|nr:ankyrin repeat-containing protein NPR4-like protein [Cinnamomum micranthum f. kanehirae]
MDARLHRAAIRGDVALLLDLLQRDEHILDGVMMMHDHIANENPLHIAAQFGHVDFAKQILSRKPEYVHKLNSQGQSPLHLASGAGHVEVVNLLLKKDVGVCFVRDKRGMTPLHIAARKGRLEVLKELVIAERTAAWVQTDQGEPILHLCASNGQFEALKMLIKLISDNDFVNMKDDDENSILHLLAPEIQIEVIEFLLSNRRLDINCLNIKKYTPLDALVKAPRRSGFKKCKRILCGAGGKRAKEISQALAVNHPKSTWQAHANWLNETKSSLMVVAILIATVTYQAALNPPGGVWQDNYPPRLSPGDNITAIRQWYADYETYIERNSHVVGESVMSSDLSFGYLTFSFFNLISLFQSLSIILLLISGFNLKRRGLMWVLMISMWISIGSMAVSYTICFLCLTNSYAWDNARIDNVEVPPFTYVIVTCAALTLIGPLVIAHLVRLVIRHRKKSRILKFGRSIGTENREGAAIQVSVDQTRTP